jgi:hypothetical protein
MTITVESGLKERRQEVTLDEETLKRIAQEVIKELGAGCGVSRVGRLAGSTFWCIHFTDSHGPLCNDFREYVGGSYEEELIRKRIRDFLSEQHGEKAGAGK